MREGTVKFFNEAKGFGFIIASDTKEEIFVHQTALKSHIRENDNVEFEVERGPKGLSATNVKVINN